MIELVNYSRAVLKEKLVYRPSTPIFFDGQLCKVGVAYDLPDVLQRTTILCVACTSLIRISYAKAGISPARSGMTQPEHKWPVCCWDDTRDGGTNMVLCFYVNPTNCTFDPLTKSTRGTTP